MTNTLARQIAAFFPVLCCAVTMGAAGPSTAPTSLTLRDATPLRLRLAHSLAFAGLKPGDLVELEIADDLRIDGVLVAAHGTRAVGTIVQAEPKSREHRGGLLGLNLESVPLLNSATAPIRAAKAATPPRLLTFGPNESFAEGTEIAVTVNGEVKLDPSTFLEDISFTSNPPGALVVMYGAPVGQTPFTTRLAPGAYKAIFSADGRADLSQKIAVGPGYPTTVHAELKP